MLVRTDMTMTHKDFLEFMDLDDEDGGPVSPMRTCDGEWRKGELTGTWTFWREDEE